MEVINVYNNIDDPEERLYSVLLNEEEFKAFSEEGSKKEKVGKALKIGGTLSTVGGTIISLDAFKSKIAVGTQAIGKALEKTGGDVEEARKLLQRFGKTSKKVKQIKRNSKIGLGLKLGGAGAVITGKVLSKKKKDKD